MIEKVIVEIDPKTGDITYEIEGVVGSKCTDITSVLGAGKKVISDELKQSYYDTESKPEYISNL